MADLLIKNMEMPKEKDDVVILTIQPDGTTNIFGRRLLSLLRSSAEIHGLRKGITTAQELPPHGRLVDIDKMIAVGRTDYFPVNIQSLDDLADFLESYADLDETDHTVIVPASK